MRSPEEHTRAILQRTKEAIETSYAEIPGKKHILKISNVTFGKVPESDDYSGQKTVLFARGTLGTDYFAEATLVDAVSGHVLDTSKVKLGILPIVTNRHSFVVNGKEYIVHNQVRLKPGIYTKLDRNENAVADFNLAKGSNFSISYLPTKGELQIEMGGAHLPLYTLLKDVFLVGDSKLEQTFGRELHQQQMDKYIPKKVANIDKLLGTITKRMRIPPTLNSEEDKLTLIRNYFSKTSMDPELNKMTLNSSYEKVTAESLLHAASDVMAIYQNKKDPTWKDNLAFKNVHGTEDFIHEKFTKKAIETKAKMRAKIDIATKVKDIGISYYFKAMLDDFFIFSDLVNYPMQVNPMEMMENAHKITSLGEGGISSTEALPLDARNNHSSELGYIDPVRTPDNLRAGVDNRVSIGAVKKGNSLYSWAYDAKGKLVQLSPQDLYHEIYSFKQERPDSLGLYNAFYQGKMVKVKKDKIKYFLSGDTMFTVSTSSIPFLEATHPQRAAMGAKMLTQALSLVDREAPLVATEVHNKVISSTLVPKSKVNGVVHKIENDSIIVKADDGSLHAHNIPHNFPLNYHSYIHADPIVKEGTQVKKGEQLAEHNFSKNGQLALGKNLKVAFIPYKGYNYEDAIVVTETGAKKLGSQHIFQEDMEISSGGGTVIDSEKFRAFYPNKFTMQQLSLLDRGIIKKGAILHHGDPIITALRSKRESPEVAELGKMSSRFSNPYNDESRVWTKDYPGEVIEVVRNTGNIRVVIKATAPLVVADKLCYDEETEVLTLDGWKLFKDVKVSDPIYTLNPSTHDIEVNPVKTVYSYETGDRMYKIKSQQIDLFVTVNHNMYAAKRYHEFEFHKAEALKGKLAKYKKDGNWKGKEVSTMNFVGHSYIANKTKTAVKQAEDLSLPTKDFMFLLGAFLSEGSCFYHEDSGSYGVSIALGNNVKQESFVKRLSEAELKACIQKTEARIYSKTLYNYFKDLGKASTKFIPKKVFSFSKKLLTELFDWMVWGDGDINKTAYYTSSKQLADDFQRLCLLIGKAANISKRHEEGIRFVFNKDCYCQTAYRVAIINKKLTPTVNHSHSHQQSIQEEEIVENYNKPVFCVEVENHLVYVRRNGIPCWSGNSNTYGGKGVVSIIVPDSEAPRNLKGEVPDVLLNPAGVPSRKNVSQIFETILGKVIKEKSLPQAEHKYFNDLNSYEKVADFAKAHGVKDTETYVDPKTGKHIEGVMDGYQYMLKLHKQAESSFAARAGGKYDIDLRPVRGGEEGAKNVGALEFYGFLAHKGGSRNLLREAATYKAEYNPEVWKAILTGQEPPPPKPTFAYEKFLTMLKGAGINVKKEGNELKLLPFIDRDILKLSNGQIHDSSIVMAKPDPVTALPFRPEEGGLFDPKTTGGLIGKQWAHVELHAPVANPLFEKPIRALLDLKTNDFDSIAHGEKHVTVNGKELTGGAAIKGMLQNIDRDKEIIKLQNELATVKSISKKDIIIKKLKYLKTLQNQDIHPHEAYTMQNVPIIPPQFRPIYPQDDGRTVVSDINHIYANLINANNALKSPIMQDLGTKSKDYTDTYKEVYNQVKAVQGLDKASNSGKVTEREPAGFLKTIIGNNQVKNGYFQSKLLSRGQDLIGRGVISVDPSLGMDQIGLPEPMAWTLYGPFVIGQLVRSGYTVEKAMAEVEQRSQAAKNVLMAEMKERPVLGKRDPVLHKFGVMAFNPELVSGKQIKFTPLAIKGLAGDFDGDAIAIHVPMTKDSIKDAYNMLPSKNLFNALDKSPMHVPGQESIMGAYKATMPMQATAVRTFKTKEEAKKAYEKGEIKINDRINITGI